MENNIIEQIAERSFPDTMEIKRNAVIDILTALEPLILKWVYVKDGLPEVLEYVLLKTTSGMIFKGRRFNNGWTAFYADGEHKIPDKELEAWQSLPSTTHPYEQLYNQLKSTK